MSNPVEAFGEAAPAAAESAGTPPAIAAAEPGWIEFSGLTELVEMGGPVTLVLVAMSVITLTVVLAKLWQFTRSGVGRAGALDDALAHWSQRRQDEAVDFLTRPRRPAAHSWREAQRAMPVRAGDGWRARQRRGQRQHGNPGQNSATISHLLPHLLRGRSPPLVPEESPASITQSPRTCTR